MINLESKRRELSFFLAESTNIKLEAWDFQRLNLKKKNFFFSVS